MTRKLFTIVVLGLAVLVLGVQGAVASGGSDLTAMIQAREKALGRTFQLGDFAVNNTWRVALEAKPQPSLRSSSQLTQLGNGPCGSQTYAIVIDGRVHARMC